MREISFASSAIRNINNIYKECFEKSVEYLRMLPNMAINIEVEEEELSTYIITDKYGKDDEISYFNGIKLVIENGKKNIILKTESSDEYNVYYGLNNGLCYTNNEFIIEILSLLERAFKTFKNEVFTLTKEYNIDGTIDIDVEVFSDLTNAISVMNETKCKFKESFGECRDLEIDDTCHENGMFIFAPSDDYSLDMKIEKKEIK